MRHPTAKMLAGEMKPVDVSDEDLKALVAYIKSLK
jgi:cytochrome c1